MVQGFNMKFKKITQEALSDYANNTTIHGIKYLLNENILVRAFWFVVMIASITGCSYLIIDTYNKWDDSTVIVSFDEQSTPIWKVPFPAVTICPETMFKRSLFNISSYGDKKQNLSEDIIVLQNALNLICPLGQHVPILRKNINVAKELKKIAIPFEEIFSTCVWRGTRQKCQNIFHELHTEEGICYTANMLDHNELFNTNVDESINFPKHKQRSTNWTLDGYKTYDSEIYPERILGAGQKAGLYLLLSVNKSDIEYRCKGFTQGFKLILHSPTDIPRFSKHFYRVGTKKEISFSVKPHVITTSKNLYNYKPEIRKCYFEDEKKLKFFKIYSQSNCELECLTNYTLNLCHCVRFGMPFDNTTQVCNFVKNTCTFNVEAKMMLKILNRNLKKENAMMQRQNYKINEDDKCKCLPTCTSIKYDAVISQGDYLNQEFYQAMHFKKNDENYITNLMIYFEDDDFIALKRSELKGFSQFLSDCGGLLGLFMGVSLISLAEFFYYMTLRWTHGKKENIEIIRETEYASTKIAFAEFNRITNFDNLVLEDINADEALEIILEN